MRWVAFPSPIQHAINATKTTLFAKSKPALRQLWSIEVRTPRKPGGKIEKSTPNPLQHYTLNPLSQLPVCAHLNQPLTSVQRPLLFGVRRDLMHATGRKCTVPTIRIWQPTPLTAPSQRLHQAHPRSAAPATSPNSAAPLDTPRRVGRQHPEVAVPQLARRWH